MPEPAYGAALLLGLLGSSHCLVMCGGIGVALGIGTDGRQRYSTLLLFQIGRILTYSALGAGLAALAAQAVSLSVNIGYALRVAAGLMLVAMGCYIANWWRGLVLLESGGNWLWRKVQPLAAAHLPVRRRRDALLVGLCWGFLPCGLIYSALAWTGTSASPLHGAALMFCFGLGTLPAMLATGLAAERLAAILRRQDLRSIAAIVLVGAGCWTAWAGVSHLQAAGTGEESPGQHSHH